MKKKMPAIMFYTADWLEDQAVQVCCLAAQGLWINMLCYMNKSPRRGALMLNEAVPMNSEHIARLVGSTASETEALLEELVRNGVPSVEETEHGPVYVSRRMLKDEAKRAKCAQAGRKGGGNPNWKPKGIPEDKPSDSITITVSDPTSAPEIYTDSSSEKYFYGRYPGVEAVWKMVPSDRQRSPQKSKVAIGRAIERVLGGVSPQEDGDSLAHAVDMLGQKAKSYYESVEGRSKYFRSPNTFFDEGGWMEDDSVWMSREEIAGQGERF